MSTQRWVLHPGSARIPGQAAPDVRGRSYEIRAEVWLAPGDGGTLLAHGDRLAGYALGIRAGRLAHDYVHAGKHTRLIAPEPVPTGCWTAVGVRVTVVGPGAVVALLVDGFVVADGTIPRLCRDRLGCSGLDVGCDRGLTVGGYPAPDRFSGRLRPIVVDGAADQVVDLGGALAVETALG
jgi:arylsulfatase